MIKFIKNNYINALILMISVLFIVGGVINRGFSSFFLAIPFVIIFFVSINRYSKKNKIIFIGMLMLLCVSLGWKIESNVILYPNLGSIAKFNAGWGHLKYTDSEYYSLIEPNNIKFYSENESALIYTSKSLVVLTEPISLKMISMNVSVADFGFSLIPIFKDEKGRKYSIYSLKLIKGIKEKSIVSNDLNGVKNFQSKWTESLSNLMYWPMLPFLILKLLQI